MVGVGGYLAYPWVYPKFVAWQAARTAKKEPIKPRVVPVIAVAARSADMDIYLSGLGTVTAFNSVTVRSRVDGELIILDGGHWAIVEHPEQTADALESFWSR